MTKIRVTVAKPSTPGSPGAGDDGTELAHRIALSQSVTYESTKLPHSGSTNDEYIDSQFQKPPVRIPVRSIVMAAFLCFAGTVLLVLGLLVVSGHLDSKFADRIWPMIIMGLLMFIPGAYHVRIAYCAYKGYPGYSFEDIPEFE